MESTSELQDYVRTLYQRQSEHNTKEGMTVWAILAAMVGITWHLFELLSKIDSSGLTSKEFYLAFSVIYITIFLSGPFLISLESIAKRTHYDYRNPAKTQTNSPLNQILLNILLFLIPLASLKLSMNLDANIYSFELTLITIDFYVTIILLLFFIAIYLYASKKKK